MRKLLLVCSIVVALASSAVASSAVAAPVQPDATTTILVGGGTPLTNGVFFPGTAIRQDSQWQGAPPASVTKGTDFELVMVDEAAVANGHKLISFKRKKGRPLFQSELLSSPGDRSLVATSNLKPGVYPYYCPIHAGMYGRIQIVDG